MRRVFRNLTPGQAFYKYAYIETERPVELFISNFMQDGYTDLTAMCERYAKEAVEIEDRLATIEEIDHVAKLLEQYMGNYIENKGGISKLELYTVEECDEIFYNSWEITLDAIKKFRK